MKKFLLAMTFVLPVVLSGCSDEDSKKINILLPEKELTLTVGEVKHMTYTLSPKSAENIQVLWTSSSYEIAYINERGGLTACKEGEAEITALLSDSQVRSTCKVKIIPANANVEGITLNESEINIAHGNTFTLIPAITPASAKNKDVTWHSSDIWIANVDTKGVVKARMVGECTIKAISEDGKFQATCKVNVVPILLEGLRFDSDSYEMEIYRGIQLAAITTPENADYTKMFWKSTNPQVAIVSESGVVRARDYGTTVIVVETEDGKFTDSCWIEVVDMPRLMKLSFTLSSGARMTNGSVWGTVYCHITNNSSEPIKLTNFYVRDSGNGWETEIEDKEQLGILAPAGRASWGFNLDGCYNPVFTYEYEYTRELYTVSKQLSPLSFN